MTLTRMFVAGEWRAALDGAEERASSPATGEDLGAVAWPTHARGAATSWRGR